ncbi:hypothetical protein DL93DRAFT_2162906 [Clavulina sp. PMI_390]|nr:hypothetical protein DL93DRAFT_2162906 [Clavulina sp. PMI_390]
MDTMEEPMAVAAENSTIISGPVAGTASDEEELMDEELAALQQEVLDAKLSKVEHVPTHTPATPINEGLPPTKAPVDDDDEAELRKLQDEMAM